MVGLRCGMRRCIQVDVVRESVAPVLSLYLPPSTRSFSHPVMMHLWTITQQTMQSVVCFTACEAVP